MEEEIKELEENKLKIEREIDEKKAVLNEEQNELADEIEFFSEDSKDAQERKEKIKVLEGELEELEKLEKIAKIRWGEILKSRTPKQDNNYVVIKFGPEEYGRLGKIAESFTEKGISPDVPEFVILTGGIASGKTTSRRKFFAEGYVNLDYWDIYLAVEKEFGEGDPKLIGFGSLVGDMILYESIEARKNIVIEIVGSEESILKPVLDGMRDVGYKLIMQLVLCDPVQAYKRHLNAVASDKDYQSAYYTERPTLSFFYSYFKLGEIPAPVDQDK